jgi:hypothetical protein
MTCYTTGKLCFHDTKCGAKEYIEFVHSTFYWHFCFLNWSHFVGIPYPTTITNDFTGNLSRKQRHEPGENESFHNTQRYVLPDGRNVEEDLHAETDRILKTSITCEACMKCCSSSLSYLLYGGCFRLEKIAWSLSTNDECIFDILVLWWCRVIMIASKGVGGWME